MGLIEKGIVSNHQCNSSITSFIYLFIYSFIYLLIYSKLPGFYFNNKMLSFSIVFWCSFLMYATGKIEMTNPTSSLNK